MRISIRLDPDREKKLADLTRETRQRTTDVVKQAIDLYHERSIGPRQRPLAALLESGFIGSGASGDPDFSTGYKKDLFEPRSAG